MTPLLLDALARARTARQTALLATRLRDGAQILLLDQDGRLDPHPAAILDDRTLAAIADLANDAARDARSQLVRHDDAEWFLHVHAPPPRLLVIGAVHIAQQLVPMARASGFVVALIDPRESFATADRFPDTTLLTLWPDTALRTLCIDRHSAVIVLTHDPKLDDPALVVALPSPAFFVGALGSTRTQDARRTRLRQAGLTNAAIDRLRGPIGLPIGAVGAAEIAVSVLAEIVAVRRSSPLADRTRWPDRTATP